MSISRKSVLRILLVLVLAVVVTTMVVPYRIVEAAFMQFGWLRQAIDLIDTVAPGLEASHLISFGILGFLARFGWPRQPRNVAIGILVVAAFVETVQIWVPGRQAALSHAFLEALGGLAGFGLAWLLTYAWGPASVPDDYKSSTHWRGENSDR